MSELCITVIAGNRGMSAENSDTCAKGLTNKYISAAKSVRFYAPSAESFGLPRMGQSESSTPTFVDYNATAGGKDAYPAWSSERSIPLSKEEIEDIFLDLTQKFGFQRDSMRNMVSLTHFHRIPAC